MLAAAATFRLMVVHASKSSQISPRIKGKRKGSGHVTFGVHDKENQHNARIIHADTKKETVRKCGTGLQKKETREKNANVFYLSKRYNRNEDCQVSTGHIYISYITCLHNMERSNTQFK